MGYYVVGFVLHKAAIFVAILRGTSSFAGSHTATLKLVSNYCDMSPEGLPFTQLNGFHGHSRLQLCVHFGGIDGYCMEHCLLDLHITWTSIQTSAKPVG